MAKVDLLKARVAFLEIENPSWQELASLLKAEKANPVQLLSDQDTDADRLNLFRAVTALDSEAEVKAARTALGDSFVHDQAIEAGRRLFARTDPHASMDEIQAFLMSDAGAQLLKANSVSNSIAKLQKLVVKARAKIMPLTMIPYLGGAIRKVLHAFETKGVLGLIELNGGDILKQVNRSPIGKMTEGVQNDLKKRADGKAFKPGIVAAQLLELALVKGGPAATDSETDETGGNWTHAFHFVTSLALSLESVLSDVVGQQRFHDWLGGLDTFQELVVAGHKVVKGRRKAVPTAEHPEAGDEITERVET